MFLRYVKSIKRNILMYKSLPISNNVSIANVLLSTTSDSLRIMKVSTQMPLSLSKMYQSAKLPLGLVSFESHGKSDLPKQVAPFNTYCWVIKDVNKKLLLTTQ